MIKASGKRYLESQMKKSKRVLVFFTRLGAHTFVTNEITDNQAILFSLL